MSKERPLPDFESYKKLSDEQKDFHIYMTLDRVNNKMDDVYCLIEEKMDKETVNHYLRDIEKKMDIKANVWVEKVLAWGIGVVLLAILTALIGNIII